MSFFRKIVLFDFGQKRLFSQKNFWSIRQSSRGTKLEKVTSRTAEKYKTLLTGPDIPTETWDKIKEDMITELSVNPKVVDTYILNLCRSQKLFEAGLTYYYKLLENNKKPSVITTAEYLSLFSIKEKPVSEAEKEVIWKTYTEIAESYTSFDSNLATICVLALCKADYVEECINIVNKYEKLNPDDFLVGAHNELVKCLLKQGNFELAFKYLVICCSKCSGPVIGTYRAYLNYCMEDGQTFTANIERLFMLLKEFGVIPPKNVIEDYITICNKHGWSAEMTTLTKSKCDRCKYKVVNSNITAEEFETLRENMCNKLLFDKRYEISNPYEVKSFIQFLELTKPYDVVIDALNVIYRMSSAETNPEALFLLANYFKSCGKRILIIGRSHLMKYSHVRKLMKTTNFYFLKNVSEDDQFILYATIVSGKDTIFISNDYMRQHKFALNDPKITILFKKWQHLHQYTFNIDLNKKVNIQLLSGSHNDPKHTLNSGVEKNGDFWHVPFVDYWHVVRGFVANPRYWVCFRVPQSQSNLQE